MTSAGTNYGLQIIGNVFESRICNYHVTGQRTAGRTATDQQYTAIGERNGPAASSPVNREQSSQNQLGTEKKPPAARSPSSANTSSSAYSSSTATLESDPSKTAIKVPSYSVPVFHQTTAQNNIHSPVQELPMQVGAGYFGVVYKCWDDKEHRFFAAKAIKPEADKLSLAVQEIQTLSRIDHPRIVRYLGCQRNHQPTESLVIFMEYMQAGSLRKMMDGQQKAISEAKCTFYLAQILDALAYVHNLDIVHNDLKCDNLLLDGEGNVKLGDFGIAVQLRVNGINNETIGLFQPSTMIARGSLYWMAPEVLTNNRFGRRADIWSLGCTVVEMLTGRPPHSDVPAQLFPGRQSALVYDPNRLLPAAVSLEMKGFLFRLLRKSPAERLHTAAEASQHFAQTVGGGIGKATIVRL